MRLADVMTVPVETIPTATPAPVAWDRMRFLHIHHLVVVDSEGKVEGVVSAGDLGGRHGSGIRRDLTVGQMMTPEPVTAGPCTTVSEAARLLRTHAIDTLPVVRRKRPIGIVTSHDLLKLLEHIVTPHHKEPPPPATIRSLPPINWRGSPVR